MQPAIESRTVTARGVTSAASFGMRAENSAHIFNILRSTLYSNKVLAVLREYSANAWDEHRAAGIPDRPIKVVLPTALEPTLRVRDYGRGLSEQQVFEVYTQYGSSTKRGDDLTVGALGIGSKSAFAYADSFTVTSWHGGQKSVYVAVLDETNVGTMSLMWRGPCDPSETGIEVSMAVDVADCPRFHREAVALYPYFDPRPEINVVLPTPRPERSEHGDVDGFSSNWVAVMGCIPYAVDMNNLREDLARESLTSLARCGGTLRFDIGEVSISASREGLEYTPRTRAAIVRRLHALVADVQDRVARIIDDPTVSDWERRMSVISASRFVGMLVQSKWNAHGVNIHKHVASVSDTEAFTMRRTHRHTSKPPEATWSIDVVPSARIIVRDVNRSHKWYPISTEDRIVYPVKDVDLAEAALHTALQEADLGGIPVVRLSTLPYTPTARRSTTASTPTPAARERHFLLKPGAFTDYRLAVPSRNWESVAHTPSPDDVFVVLDAFRPRDIGDHTFASQIRSDRDCIAWLGGSMPRLVGYRASAKSPVDPSKVPGRPYKRWRVEFVRDLLAAQPDKAEMTRVLSWTTVSIVSGYRWRHDAHTTVRAVTEYLGVDHPVTTYLQTILDAGARCASIYHKDREIMSYIISLVGIDDPVVAHRALIDRYPLMNLEVGGPGFDVLLQSARRNAWLDYIRLVDASGGANPATVGVPTTTAMENP